jgi:hypothetical protein
MNDLTKLFDHVKSCFLNTFGSEIGYNGYSQSDIWFQNYDKNSFDEG